VGSASFIALAGMIPCQYRHKWSLKTRFWKLDPPPNWWPPRLCLFVYRTCTRARLTPLWLCRQVPLSTRHLRPRQKAAYFTRTRQRQREHGDHVRLRAVAEQLPPAAARIPGPADGWRAGRGRSEESRRWQPAQVTESGRSETDPVETAGERSSTEQD